MKSLRMLAAVVALWALAGCELPQDAPASEEMNRWIVESYGDDAIKNAIIAQHTLYPYHFIPNDALLSPLGEHDLRILTEHFRDHPGQLNVRRGNTDEALYQARVQTVVRLLKDDGAGAGKLVITDALPGGDGAPADQVLKIRAQDDRGSKGGTSATGSVTAGPANTSGA